MIVAAALGSIAPPAMAATEVRGQMTAMQLRAENASIREILDVLAATFKLSYKVPASLSGQFSGLYSGTLHQVLARILDGNDYIIEVSDGEIEVIVLSVSAKSFVVPVVQPAISDAQGAVTADPAIAPPNPTVSTSDNAAAPSSPIPPLASFR